MWVDISMDMDIDKDVDMDTYMDMVARQEHTKVAKHSTIYK
jgi:hypothetical protein